jgi:hypothetical protein
MSGFQLRRLQVTGPQVESAEITFDAGLNVVSGASDTGKSYLVETIDYMLGAGTPPRQIPESRGYDTAQLLIAAQDGREFQLTRALAGGDFLLGDLAAGAADPVTLGQRHSAGTGENISTFLLRLIGLDGKRVRKNAQNELQNLSFRNLAHLVIVDEESIIKKGSPIHSGESTQRTTQSSVFKLLLTGQDDGALIAAKKPAIAKAELEAKIALLDQLIAEYEGELGELTSDPGDLGAQLERLDASLVTSAQALHLQRSAFEEQENARQTAWQTRDEIRARHEEILALLERFTLLDQHYGSDLDRLEAVSEAGFFFVALDTGRCPLCGAPAGDHHHHDGVQPDGDIEATRTACAQEIVKILQLRAELALTVSDLQDERRQLSERFDSARAAYRTADALVREALTPAVSAARAEHTGLLETRAGVRQAIALVERISDLRSRRMDAESALGTSGRVTDERPGLPPASVQAFSAAVETLLDAWRFPHEKPIYFDERSQDLILGARRRGEQGKGLRALTHAAFSIGLLQTCRVLQLPAVGFVILDSPLVTFREADREEAGLDAAARLEVKQAFYRDLAERITSDQVIIVENEDPDASLRAGIVSHIFTKRSDSGRPGFFPVARTPVLKP